MLEVHVGVSFFEGTLFGVGLKGPQKENHLCFSGVPPKKTHPCASLVSDQSMSC